MSAIDQSALSSFSLFLPFSLVLPLPLGAALYIHMRTANASLELVLLCQREAPKCIGHFGEKIRSDYLRIDFHFVLISLSRNAYLPLLLNCLSLSLTLCRALVSDNSTWRVEKKPARIRSELYFSP